MVEEGCRGIGSHLHHSWDILPSQNAQRPVFGVGGDLRVRCVWGCVFFNANLVKTADR